ncbi:MAG: hypothetical protein Q9199_005710 [Rusavskia elegans]
MKEVYSRHYQIQAAFTGSDTQTGPMVKPCRTVFDMETAGKYGNLQQLDFSRCRSFPNCNFTFLNLKITGAAFIMHRSTGHVPESQDRANDSESTEAQAKLEFVVTNGGWLVNGTGFGKTITALLFVSQMALYGDHAGQHRPTALVLNGAVFAQWCDTIYEHFRNLVLVISNDAQPPENKYWNNWISAQAMREAPSLSTNGLRTSEWLKQTGTEQPFQSRSKRYADETRIFTNKWKYVIGLGVNDEAHRLRHTETKRYASIEQLDFPISWLLTANPFINTLEYGIENSITSEDTTKVAKYFQTMDDLDSISRSTTSSLNKNESGEKISLKSMMPSHKVRTAVLQYDEDEAAEAEWFGQDSAWVAQDQCEHRASELQDPFDHLSDAKHEQLFRKYTVPVDGRRPD